MKIKASFSILLLFALITNGLCQTPLKEAERPKISKGTLIVAVPTRDGLVICADRRLHNRASGNSDTALKIRPFEQGVFVASGYVLWSGALLGTVDIFDATQYALTLSKQQPLMASRPINWPNDTFNQPALNIHEPSAPQELVTWRPEVTNERNRISSLVGISPSLSQELILPNPAPGNLQVDTKNMSNLVFPEYSKQLAPKIDGVVGEVKPDALLDTLTHLGSQIQFSPLSTRLESLPAFVKPLTGPADVDQIQNNSISIPWQPSTFPDKTSHLDLTLNTHSDSLKSFADRGGLERSPIITSTHSPGARVAFGPVINESLLKNAEKTSPPTSVQIPSNLVDISEPGKIAFNGLKQGTQEDEPRLQTPSPQFLGISQIKSFPDRQPSELPNEWLKNLNLHHQPSTPIPAQGVLPQIDTRLQVAKPFGIEPTPSQPLIESLARPSALPIPNDSLTQNLRTVAQHLAGKLRWLVGINASNLGDTPGGQFFEIRFFNVDSDQQLKQQALVCLLDIDAMGIVRNWRIVGVLDPDDLSIAKPILSGSPELYFELINGHNKAFDDLRSNPFIKPFLSAPRPRDQVSVNESLAFAQALIKATSRRGQEINKEIHVSESCDCGLLNYQGGFRWISVNDYPPPKLASIKRRHSGRLKHK